MCTIISTRKNMTPYNKNKKRKITKIKIYVIRVFNIKIQKRTYLNLHSNTLITKTFKAKGLFKYKHTFSQKEWDIKGNNNNWVKWKTKTTKTVTMTIELCQLFLFYQWLFVVAIKIWNIRIEMKLWKERKLQKICTYIWNI